ncbi:hypothetical protein BJV74DRAFT_378667 [Russula compacta]|nr:hypothetical protein BJV74DRAFT_378667 [Russula compacta]
MLYYHRGLMEVKLHTREVRGPTLLISKAYPASESPRQYTSRHGHCNQLRVLPSESDTSKLHRRTLIPHRNLQHGSGWHARKTLRKPSEDSILLLQPALQGVHSLGHRVQVRRLHLLNLALKRLCEPAALPRLDEHEREYEHEHVHAEHAELPIRGHAADLVRPDLLLVVPREDGPHERAEFTLHLVFRLRDGGLGPSLLLLECMVLSDQSREL